MIEGHLAALEKALLHHDDVLVIKTRMEDFVPASEIREMKRDVTQIKAGFTRALNVTLTIGTALACAFLVYQFGWKS